MAIGATNSGGTNAAFSTGLGSVSPNTLITGWAIEKLTSRSGQVIAAILVANSPQLVLSVIYFNVNYVLTAMSLGREWNSYAATRQPLRTSSPRGSQKRTNFLSLPYEIAIPLASFSVALHWLVSQSIFLAVLHETDSNGALAVPFLLVTCGFSPLAMVCTLVVGMVMLVSVVVCSRLKLKNDMPIVRSCSVAIAAACRNPLYREGDEMKLLQWGDVGVDGEEAGVGRCAFSARPVERLVVGKAYA